MKSLLLSVCLLLSLGANAQGWKNPLPLDSATHLVAYSGVVEVPGASKAELYSRAREWFATSFGSAKAVLEMDDREAGKLIGNTNSDFTIHYGGILGEAPVRLWRTIRVEVKEGKYRYALSNFATSGYYYAQSDARPVEEWFKASRILYNKDGSPKPSTASVVAGVQQSAEGQAASLKAAMTKATAKGW
jgi:hypothetical protein